MSTKPLPRHWKMATLDDVAAPIPNAIADGPFGSNLKLEDYVPEGVPVLQGKNITDDTFRWLDVRFISKRKAEELKRSRVRVGDVLIVKIGSIGYSAVLDGLNGFDHAIIPANLAKVTPDLNKVDPRYLHRWLISTASKQYLIRVASKTAQPALSLGKIKDLPVPLPPLPEQRRIAEILDKADALRAKRRAVLAQHDTLTQSIFLDMFGDPATNPKGWPLVLLGEHASKIGSGATPLGGETAYKADGIALIRSMNVRDGRFCRVGLAFIDEQQAARLDGVVVQGEDVLLNITGASVARVCRAPSDVLPARVNQHVAIIRPMRAFDTRFLEQCLLYPSMKRRLLRIAGAGATREAITKDAIERLTVIQPPRELQNAFGGLVRVQEVLKSVQETHLNAANAVFGALQDRAFRGEL